MSLMRVCWFSHGFIADNVTRLGEIFIQMYIYDQIETVRVYCRILEFDEKKIDFLFLKNTR